MYPVEGRPGIGLSTGCDITVSDEFRISQARIGGAQGRNKRGKACVLRCLVGHIVSSLEFDADGKIVAGRPAAEGRLARMPCALAEGHELRQ